MVRKIGSLQLAGRVTDGVKGLVRDQGASLSCFNQKSVFWFCGVCSFQTFSFASGMQLKDDVMSR